MLNVHISLGRTDILTTSSDSFYEEGCLSWSDLIFCLSGVIKFPLMFPHVKKIVSLFLFSCYFFFITTLVILWFSSFAELLHWLLNVYMRAIDFCSLYPTLFNTLFLLASFLALLGILKYTILYKHVWLYVLFTYSVFGSSFWSLFIDCTSSACLNLVRSAQVECSLWCCLNTVKMKMPLGFLDDNIVDSFFSIKNKYLILSKFLKSLSCDFSPWIYWDVEVKYNYLNFELS